MKEEIDINKQYEEIFGREQRPNIFAPDDEEYASLRREILDAKREYNPDGVLPFEGLTITFYEEMCESTNNEAENGSSHDVMNEVMEPRINIANVVDNLVFNFATMFDGIIIHHTKKQEEVSSHKIFFIKRTSPTKEIICDACGYYDVNTKKFILQAGSILAAGYAGLLKNLFRNIFLSSHCSRFSQGYKLEQDYAFNAPSTAAGYVLGRSANGWQEWKDCDGNTLDSVYRKLGAENK